MKFFRLTSVVLCCALLSSFLILPASATDDDSYYSVPAISEPSLAVEWPVNPVMGEYDSILGTISRQLGAISTQISDVLKNQVSTAQILSGISGILTNNGRSLGRIESSVSSSNSILSTISAGVSAISDKVATETTLSGFKDLFSTGFLRPRNDSGSVYDASFSSLFSAVFTATDNGILVDRLGPAFNFNIPSYNPNTNTWFGYWGSFTGVLGGLVSTLGVDGQIPGLGYSYSLYHYVKNLSETLASEDDKQLAQNQKENREQIEKDFVNGSSGKTSLGKDDFGSLSSVGGTFKDTISLNGQSSLFDLTSGLSDADTAGQGWFSQATKDSLDAVSGSTSSESTVSTFSDDGLYSVDVDPDPYHMQGFEENYAWLWGDDDG